MTARPAFSEPSKTQVVDGEVVVDGPCGLGLSFTPQAARETGRRLTDAADAAEGKRPADLKREDGPPPPGAAT